MRIIRPVAFLLGCLIVGAAGCVASVASDDGRLRSEVLAAREAIWRAWFANDVDVLHRMLPTEFVGIGFGGGPVETRDVTLRASAEFVRTGGKLRRLEFHDDRLQTFGDVVTVFSNYELELEAAGETLVQRGRATEVFVRRNGIWTNPAWHLDSGR